MSFNVMLGHRPKTKFLIFFVFIFIVLHVYVHTCCTTGRSPLSDTRLCKTVSSGRSLRVHNKSPKSDRLKVSAICKNAIISCNYTVCSRYRNTKVLTKLFSFEYDLLQFGSLLQNEFYQGTAHMYIYVFILCYYQEHRTHPFELHVDTTTYRVRYEPGESETKLFGGNSNWRGPIWLPSKIFKFVKDFHCLCYTP